MNEVANMITGNVVGLPAENQSQVAGTNSVPEGVSGTGFAEILKLFLGAGTALLAGNSATITNLPANGNTVFRVDQDVGDLITESSGELDGEAGEPTASTGLQQIPVNPVSGQNQLNLANSIPIQKVPKSTSLQGSDILCRSNPADQEIATVATLLRNDSFRTDSKGSSVLSLIAGHALGTDSGVAAGEQGKTTGPAGSSGVPKPLFSGQQSGAPTVMGRYLLDTVIQRSEINNSADNTAAARPDGTKLLFKPNAGSTDSVDIAKQELIRHIPNAGSDKDGIVSDVLPKTVIEQVIRGQAYVQPNAKTVKFADTIIEQIVQKLMFLKFNERSEIRIKLQPEILGDLRIKVTVENGVLSAKLVTASHIVKEGIEAGLAQLKQNLSSQGLEVHNLSVSVSGDEHSGGKEYGNAPDTPYKPGMLIAANEDVHEDVPDEPYTVNWLV